MSALEVELAPLEAGPNKRGISWVETVAGVLILIVVCVFGSAQAQTCPGPPTSSLVSVDYDPLSAVDTVVNFTMSMPARTGYSGMLDREIDIWKQPFGSENEGIRYDFNHTPGGNLTVTGKFLDNLSWLGWTWRGLTPKDRMYAFGNLTQGISGQARATATFRNRQALAPGSRIIEFASFAYYSEPSACPYYSGRISTSTQSFTLNVASAMALSLAGGSTTGTMDFANNLATAAKQSVNLRLRSNTPYRVSMDSTHNGVLKLNNSPTAPDQIVYNATLNGTTITEAAPFINTNPTGTGGADVTLPFEVTIGDTSNARAGFYKDVVTITIGSPP